MTPAPGLRFCPQCAKELIDLEHGGLLRRACPDPACGFVFWDNPTPVVAGVVEHEGAVVLIQNQEWPPGWWGLVTGFLERGETPEVGMVREVEEELGLAATLEGFLGHYFFKRRNQLIIAYHLRAEGEIVMGEELRAFKRIAPEKIRPWREATGQALSDWLAQRGYANARDFL